ncbi:MAG: recombinase family protein [Thermoguttaceae bacterium]
MDLGYARVSTTKQDLDRQIDALTTAGIKPEHIYLDKKSGATTDRPGLTTLLKYARNGDVIVVHTLDRLGRTVRDTLNLIHDLRERGIGVRNLADPIKIDTNNPDDPMAQLAVVLLALFGQMERTYTIERAAHARAVATAKGRRIGRPSVVDEAHLAYAIQLRDGGATIAEIIAKTGLTRSTLYRHLPARPPELVTGAAALVEGIVPTSLVETESVDPLACPSCGHRPTSRRELIPHLADLETVWLRSGRDGHLQEGQHCANCQPHVEVLAVACVRCGEGPLIIGVGGASDDGLPGQVNSWLADHGWTLTPELLCPDHR